MASLILGIESSCDETAAALVSQSLEVVANVVSSQVDIHARYGGVVPELACRAHALEIMPTIERAMSDAGVSGPELAAIAVTRGPGLNGSLLVGISAAKALALSWQKPLLAVNHLEGHMATIGMGAEPAEYPCLVLLVSGGHTLIARTTGPGQNEILGRTRDDSAGEAYDKVAKLLGLGYPGGPIIDRLAKSGKDVLSFPRPMINDGLEFSFSGLKTAVRTFVRQNADFRVEDVAASFAAAVVDVLVAKLERALSMSSYRSIAIVGGVAASPILRARLVELGQAHDVRVCLPPLKLATDNAAMIAAAAWPRFASGDRDSLDFGSAPGWQLEPAV